MLAKWKVGIVGLVVLLILVGVPLALAQASLSARAREGASAAEPAVVEPEILPGSGDTIAPSDSALLLVAGTALLVVSILIGQILRLQPAEDRAGSR